MFLKKFRHTTVRWVVSWHIGADGGAHWSDTDT